MKCVLLTLLVCAIALTCLAPVSMVKGNSATKPISAAGGSSTLNTGLTAYWKLDEASGTRADSGSNAQDLSDSSTTATATGKINNGIDVEFGGPSHLYHADSSTLSLGTDTAFTFSVWLKFESFTGFRTGIIVKNTDRSGVADEYILDYRADSIERFTLTVGNGATSATVSASTFGTPSLATWYLVTAGHDPALDVLWIQVNAGTRDTAVWSGGTQDTSAEFRIGTFTDNANLCFDGVIDEPGFWKRSLSTAEVTEIYAAGIGKTCCPF